MNLGMFRKSAAEKYLRTDAPGAVISVSPPSTVALFAVLASLFVALGSLAVFGHAQVVAEGRGVVRSDEPPLSLHAPFTGRVLTVQAAARHAGGKGQLVLTMDARAEATASGDCAGDVAADQAELTSLLQRLADWNEAAQGDRNASMALVLITQIRAQREKLLTLRQRCDSLRARVDSSAVTFPVDATVAEITVSAGAQVHEGDILATLVPATATLVGYVALRETDRNAITVGQAVRLKFDALPFDEEGAGTARVAQLLDALPSGMKVDAAEGSGVFAELALESMPAAAAHARAGMTFTADVLTRRVRLAALLFGDD